jgi:hypothetical protein
VAIVAAFGGMGLWAVEHSGRGTRCAVGSGSFGAGVMLFFLVSIVWSGLVGMGTAVAVRAAGLSLDVSMIAGFAAWVWVFASLMFLPKMNDKQV